jgi:hypothetical protein
MGTGQRLSLILAIVVLPACQAGAQTMPWPSEAPRGGAPAAPWPGAGGAPTAAPMPGPMPGAGAPPGMGMGMGAPPPMGGAGTPPCMAEFTKLREEVQKRGQAAKAAGEHKASREEMCKHITAYAVAELKWVKFTEAGVTSPSCNIPPEVAKQLKQVHANTEQTREKVCAAQAAAAPAAPSLSDALGTTRLPTPENTKARSGTLDTLTGNAIQQR